MKKLSKLFALLLSFILVISFTSCKDNEKSKDEKKDSKEVTDQYDKYLKDKNSNLLPEDYNPITNSFTQTDFQFTKLDDTTAFNLCENSYTVMTPSYTAYYFYTSPDFAQKFDGEFKTCKGITFTNTKKEALDSYNVGEDNIYDIDNLCSVIAFASNGEFEYSVLDKQSAGKINSYVTTNLNNGFDTNTVLDQFKDYTSIALCKIEADSNGILNKLTMYRFDRQ